MKFSNNIINEALAEEVKELRKELKQAKELEKNHLQVQKRQFQKQIQIMCENYEATIKELQEEIARLNGTLDRNPGNSSLPPSTDIFDKHRRKSINEYNTRKKTDRKKGGQKGRVGKSLNKKDARRLIDSGKVKHEIIDLSNNDPDPIIRYVYDLQITPIVKEVHLSKGSPLLSLLKNSVVYGSTIRSLGVYLFSEGIIAHKRVAEMLSQISGKVFHLSEGTSYNICREFSKMCEPVCQMIQKNLIQAPVLMTDLTSFKVSGKKNQIRNHSTQLDTYYFATKTKSLKDLFTDPILMDYQGILIHDHDTSVYRLSCEHAECNIHLIRYLRRCEEETHHKWPRMMIELLNEYNCLRKKLSQDKCYCFSNEKIVEFEKRFDQIIKLGFQENPVCQFKFAQNNESVLLKRLVDYKQVYTYFIYDFNIPFTNNLSERDLRKVVNRRKLIGTLHEFSGLEMYCKIMSVKETYKKRRIPLLQGIRQIQKNFFKNYLV